MKTDNASALTVNLQTTVSAKTHEVLRIESLKRKLTMGQLLDEIVGRYIGVSETTPN